MASTQISSQREPAPAASLIPDGAPETRAPRTPRQWLATPLAQGLIAGLLYWAALPPLNLWPLAWLAPVPLILLARRETLGGRRTYVQLWFSGVLFWLAALYWFTLPHWATSFGWLAAGMYAGCYWPVFVGLVRVARRLGVSTVMAAPVVWTGLELARGHLFGGFTMAGLSHTQFRWIEILQLSDLGGSYLVSGLMVLVAACLARMWPLNGRLTLWPAPVAAAAIGAALAYGQWRISQRTVSPGPTVALIQGSIDIDMKGDPTQVERIFEQYFGLTNQAVREHAPLDLIVWPETMFRFSWFEVEPGFQPPASGEWTPQQAQAESRKAVGSTARNFNTPLLLGIDTVQFTADADQPRRYNSALFADRHGKAVSRYDKHQLVWFGEFIPLAEYFPWLYRLTPLSGGLSRGTRAEAFRVGPALLSPNICYESTVSHLIRDQVNQLRAEGTEPDVLVNLTNDGWFWGSSELDMHLACGVFRAIECRKPFLIAANTGFSASIDSDGRILRQGPRRDTEVLIATPELDTRGSWYLDHGDWPAGLCLTACLALAAIGWRTRTTRPANAAA